MCACVCACARTCTCARLSPSSLGDYWDGGQDTGSGARPAKSRRGLGRTALGPRRGTWEAGYEGQRLVETWGARGARKLGELEAERGSASGPSKCRVAERGQAQRRPWRAPGTGAGGPRCLRPQPGKSPLPRSRPSACLPGSLREMRKEGEWERGG